MFITFPKIEEKVESKTGCRVFPHSTFFISEITVTFVQSLYVAAFQLLSQDSRSNKPELLTKFK